MSCDHNTIIYLTYVTHTVNMTWSHH